ncbi:hypothetical protein QZH41_013691 [Actinostola sp. cb2023]|nr:hypothetical protein QZH41_013691 [Actinostola sp. cb2023]
MNDNSTESETSNYNVEAFEPVATQDELADYEDRVEAELEEEEMLEKRFNGETELRS